MAIALFVLPTMAIGRPATASDPLRPPAEDPPKHKKPLSDRPARHYARALKDYRLKKYKAAHDELVYTSRLSSDPDLHYALAVIDMALDKCDDATREIKKFLDTAQGDNAIKAANEVIEPCNPEPTPAEPAPPKAPPKAPPPEPSPPPQPLPSPSPSPSLSLSAHSHAPRHWYRDGVGDTLVIGGAVSGAAGLYFYHRALGELDAADASKTIDEHARHVGNAHDQRNYAFVAGGAGAALFTAGLIRYWVHDRGEEPRRSIAVVPLTGGGMIAISGELE